MNDRLRQFVRKIRWNKFFGIMLKSISLIGVGFPLVMILIGLFLGLFSSFAHRANEILSVSSLIKYGKNGLVMGFIWGVMTNAFEIFLFQKMCHDEKEKQVGHDENAPKL